MSATAPQRYSAFPNSTVTVPDRGCAEVDFSTRLDGHISGHVYFSDGTPAEGVYLTAKIADSDSHEPWTWQAGYATTAPDGSFDFDRLAPGSYVFAANMDFSPVTSKGTAYLPQGIFPRRRAPIRGVRHYRGRRSSCRPSPLFPATQFGSPRYSNRGNGPGLRGDPVSHAQILAYDDMWESSVTPATANTHDRGKATLTLRSGQHYDVEAVVNLPDFSQVCAEPLEVDVHDSSRGPPILALSHSIGNCTQFKKRRP